MLISLNQTKNYYFVVFNIFIVFSFAKTFKKKCLNPEQNHKLNKILAFN